MAGVPSCRSHDVGVRRAFEDLVTEANSVPVAGWDFSWLDGRASQRLPG
jgi:hypothetical protein